MNTTSFSEEEVRILRNSFERIWPHDGGTHHRFLQRFYERFFESCPEAETLFGNIDMRVQRRMLFTALKSVLHNLENSDQMTEYLNDLGDRHASYGASQPLYQRFADCLLHCIRDADTQNWDAETNRLWTDALHIICNRMAARIATADS